VIIRAADHGDLRAIIALLADDVLGKARDFAVVDEAYEQASPTSPGLAGTAPSDA
jgi:hypothetical protein